MRTDAMQTALFTRQGNPGTVQVIGVGDAGCRAASEIWRRRLADVTVTCVDTDALSLDRSQSDRAILLGAATMHGFGSGGDTEMVKAAVQDRLPEVLKQVSGTTCVLVIAGLTGSTGSSATPVIAKAIRAAGKLTVAAAITPFEFEPIGTHLMAASSLASLRESADAVLEVPRISQGNSRSAKAHAAVALHQMFSADRNYIASFAATISTIVGASPDRCDANSGDLNSILKNGTPAVFGTAFGFGHTGAAEATEKCLDMAVAELDASHGIDRALVLIESGPDISVSHIATVTSLIERRIGADAELHTAVRRSRLLGSNIKVSVIGSVCEARRPMCVSPVRVSHPVDFTSDRVHRTANRRPVAHFTGSTRSN